MSQGKEIINTRVVSQPNSSRQDSSRNSTPRQVQSKRGEVNYTFRPSLDNNQKYNKQLMNKLSLTNPKTVI